MIHVHATIHLLMNRTVRNLVNREMMYMDILAVIKMAHAFVGQTGTTFLTVQCFVSLTIISTDIMAVP